MGSSKGSSGSDSGYVSVNNYMCHMWVLHWLNPMWHPRGQYSQIEPPCDPFRLVCWGYFFLLYAPANTFSVMPGWVFLS